MLLMITQISQICWVILKKLRASQYHNIAQGTYYELLVEANLDLFCSFA